MCAHAHILSKAKTYFIWSIILYFGKVLELYFIYTFFQSNTLKILNCRIKLSKRIKSTYFILFSLTIWYISAVYQPMSILKKNFNPSFSIFLAKKGVWGIIYISVILFHTLFRGKSYFIWRKKYTLFGNLAVATLLKDNLVPLYSGFFFACCKC